MQDRYIGDVGDFGKYGLLRGLSRGSKTKLGIIWYLFPDESHNSDGRHIRYLRRRELRHLDAQLHDRLDLLVGSGRRSVLALARSNIFPRGTVYFNKPVTPDIPSGRAARQAYRSQWSADSLSATAKCGLVFFDPDNGMEVKSVPRHASKSGKYIFWDELSPFWNRGQSLVIYHHLNRTTTVARQTAFLKKQFSKAFPTAGLLKCVLFRRGSCRHFWIVGQRKHSDELAKRLDDMMASGWKNYFELL